MTLDSLYVAYWSLKDPLCQSQVLPVIRGLASDGYRIGLMTFEQPTWALDPAAHAEAEASLRRQGLFWHPRRYHGRPAVLSTIGDIVAGAIHARRLRPRLLHGRGTVPAAVAYLASRGHASLFLNDADGPLSKEYVEAGVWRTGSPLPRLVAWSEDRFLDAADANAVLTSVRADEVCGPGRAAPVVLPCAVDTGFFQPLPAEGERLREALRLEGTVFVYAGKTGGWYLVEPMMEFVAAYRNLGEPTSLLVLTTGPREPFEQMSARRGLCCRVRSATRDEVPGYLSAAHVGLSFRLATPSQRASSPVKNGEYLACGLPVVSTVGVGDYSALVADRRVGVLVDSLDASSLRASAVALRSLLAEPGLSARCRGAAREHAGLEEVVLPRYRDIYEKLLGPLGATA